MSIAEQNHGEPIPFDNMFVIMKSCIHLDHSSGCSGCTMFKPVAQTAAAFFVRIGVPGYKLISGRRVAWRTRAKLAVRQQGKERLVIGLFAQGSHTVVPIPHCPAHHPNINRAVALLLRHFKEVHGYDEVSHQGLLRYIQLCVERGSGRVQLTLVLNSQSHDVERQALALYESDPSFWHSIWVNIQPGSTNTIFGKEWRKVAGSQFIWEELCGVHIPFSPQHFSQANLEMFERMLKDLITLIPRNARVVELFSGMGVISIVLRPHVFSTRAVERDAFAQEAFEEAKEHLPYSLQKNLSFEVADAMAASGVLKGADTVVVDPPRKGLSLDLIKRFCEMKEVSRLFYISCHFPSFERDAQLLIEGGFTVAFARSYLFFPGTDQIETLAMFSRKDLGERI